MPLRSKAGQSYVSIVLSSDDPLDEVAGRARSARLAAYYAGAYYTAGASVGGGQWAVAVATGVDTQLHPAATANLVARGCAPGQPWTCEKFEALLCGEGGRLETSLQVDRRSGHSRTVHVATTDTWVFDVPTSVSLLACYHFDDDGWLTSVVADGARSAMRTLAEQTAFVRDRGADGQLERQRGAAIHYSLILERIPRSREAPEDLSGLPPPYYHAHIIIHGAVDRQGRYSAYDAHDALTSGERQYASAYGDLVVRQRLADRGIRMRRVDGALSAPTRWEVASIPDTAIRLVEQHPAMLAAKAADTAGRPSDGGEADPATD